MSYFFILFILIFVIRLVFAIVRAIFSVIRSVRQPAQQDLWPPNYGRLLDRLHRNEYGYLYVTVSDREQKYLEWVRNLYRKLCLNRGIPEILFYRYLRELVRNETALNQLQYSQYQQDCLEALLRATHYRADRRRRVLDDWQPGPWNNIEELAVQWVAHIFQEYEVPPALTSVWWRWREPELQAFCEAHTCTGYGTGLDNGLFHLYFDLTTGGSLQANTELRFPVSRRIAAFYQRSPVQLRFDQAYWWCVYMAAGGRENTGWEVAFAPFCFEQREFWSTFLRWLAQTEASTRFNPSTQLQRLVDRLALVRFGTGPLAEIGAYRPFAGIKPNLEFTGHTPQSLWRRLHQQVRPDFPPVPGLRDAYVVGQEEGALIRLIRLKNGADLEKEGDLMGHCVGDGGYEQACLEGQTSIWSLRLERRDRPPEPLLTVELTEGRINQMEGPNHGGAMECYYRLVHRWVEHHVKL